MILNQLMSVLNNENEDAGALRIVHRCEGDYLEESCGFFGRDLRAGHPLPDLSYVNLDKAPMTGTSLAESLIMRNLTRFLCLGIARLMGKNTRKDDKTISYQTLRYRKRLYTS